MPSKSKSASLSNAQESARQIINGNLSFSNLEGCDAELSANQNPLIIKYDQLFLLRKDHNLKSPYLSYWPFFDFSALANKKWHALGTATE